MRYLDRYTAYRLGIAEGGLTREVLCGRQWEAIRETAAYAREHAPFYQKKLRGIKLQAPEDFTRLPFTLPTELSACAEEMLCVPASAVERIVTLPTGGSSGIPKRVFFTREDLQCTVDFFGEGMKLMMGPKDRLMICMPCERPGSVGRLLQEGVETHIGARVFPMGLPEEGDSFSRVLDCLHAEEITVLAGLPEHIYHLMQCTAGLHVDTVLLSGNYVSPDAAAGLHDVWGCRVFEHYGLTETGYGCAVSCCPGAGYHIRESDVYVEIIDPLDGTVLPDGCWGEVAVTTLGRKAMPLIRYRTGDISRILPRACACGSVLRRLDRVRDRHMKKGWR